MKKFIKTKNFEVTFNITNTSTVLNIIYTATSPTGEFPGISEFEYFSILKQIYPIHNIPAKEVYTTFELEMLTAYMACVKGFNDLKNNDIEESLMCGLRIEPDLKCIYMLGMMTISNERAKSLIEGMEETSRKKHSERIKFGIQRKREKELNHRKD